MKNTAIFAYLAASVAVVSATGGDEDMGGVIRHPDGSYTCKIANAAYCAGDSLKTDIIIRCFGTRGNPGRCSNNLAGEPPVGNFPSLCYQTSGTEGDAACEKNCVVYGGSGNGKGTFTLPAEICTPTYTATSSVAPTTSPTSTPSYPTTIPTSSKTEYPPHSSSKTEYPPHSSSKTEYPPHSSQTEYPTHSSVTVYPPHSSKPPHSYPTSKDCTTEESTSYPTSLITTTGYPTTIITKSTSVIYPTQNTTIYPTKPTTPTTPVVPSGPSSTPTDTPVPAGAIHNSAAGGALALVGFVAALLF